MMKVATLTFQDADNYGAMLQCYALQKSVERLGVECLVIDYKCSYLNHPYGLAALKRKGLIRFILGNINALVRKPRKKKFKAFRQEIPMTRSVTKQNIRELNNEFDSFIVGSDCVWNDDITDFDTTYLLDFVDDCVKKNSYAASFGFSKMKQNKAADYKNYLTQFNEIGVRESSGKDIIDSLLNRKAQFVLDPTLLLDRKDWDLVASPSTQNSKYIFVYQLAPSKYLLEIVKKLKVATGYDAIFIPFPVGGFIKSKIHMNDGPKEWVSLLKNAEYVVTDSFHATAFSVIYGKKVYCCVNELATRIVSLLELLGLNVFLFDRNRKFELLENVDYSKAYSVLNEKKQQSLDFLKSICFRKEGVI